MKRARKYEELISAYIDGELGERETMFVEKTLLADPVWRKRYEEASLIRNRMLNAADATAGGNLWPGLSQKLLKEKSSERTEIFPGRLAQALVVLVMIIAGLGSFLITRNWDDLTAYFNDTREVFRDIADQGLVQGALKPMFDGVTNDDLVRFALSGVLSIPGSEGRGLKVESERTDEIELELTEIETKPATPSLSQLYSSLDVTEEQKTSIETDLSRYREFIGQTAFIASNEEVVISPEIAGTDRFILASIARHLGPAQRSAFNAIISGYKPDIKLPEDTSIPEVNFFAFSPELTGTPERNFIIMRPDTVLTVALKIPDLPFLPDVQAINEEVRSTVKRELERAFSDTRILINPRLDPGKEGLTIRIAVGGDHGQTGGGDFRNEVRLDSVMFPSFSKDHFIQLRELTRQLSTGATQDTGRFIFMERDTVRHKSE